MSGISKVYMYEQPPQPIPLSFPLGATLLLAGHWGQHFLTYFMSGKRTTFKNIRFLFSTTVPVRLRCTGNYRHNVAKVLENLTNTSWITEAPPFLFILHEVVMEEAGVKSKLITLNGVEPASGSLGKAQLSTRLADTPHDFAMSLTLSFRDGVTVKVPDLTVKITFDVSQIFLFQDQDQCFPLLT